MSRSLETKMQKEDRWFDIDFEPVLPSLRSDSHVSFQPKFGWMFVLIAQGGAGGSGLNIHNEVFCFSTKFTANLQNFYAH